MNGACRGDEIGLTCVAAGFGRGADIDIGALARRGLDVDLHHPTGRGIDEALGRRNPACAGGSRRQSLVMNALEEPAQDQDDANDDRAQDYRERCAEEESGAGAGQEESP
jgi:hypothetical protein